MQGSSFRGILQTYHWRRLQRCSQVCILSKKKRLSVLEMQFHFSIFRCDRAGLAGTIRLAAVRCPAGLAFDINRQTCDWKAKVENCDRLSSMYPFYFKIWQLPARLLSRLETWGFSQWNSMVYTPWVFNQLKNCWADNFQKYLFSLLT